ncbi:hypothetical protein MNBD_BACTEROID05-1013 [hydrothermal vent metagenome]|uniref:SGNH hydrolase-type esterase domain-containing protein n=1 Tax=hydrothermal vent metagenome TaxID=652676 RepID=A0A3B0T079_9ZZZZ
MANICIFGDSVAHGGSDFEYGGWAVQLGGFYEKNGVDRWNHVYNLGIDGNTTEKITKRFDAEAGVRRVDVCIFATGVQDSKYFITPDQTQTSVDDFKKLIETLVRKAKVFTNHIIFIGIANVDEGKVHPIPWGSTNESYGNENIKKFNDIIKNVCDESNVSFIDMAGLFDVKKDFHDGVHPNTHGHKKMYKRIRDFLIENQFIKLKN